MLTFQTIVELRYRMHNGWEHARLVVDVTLTIGAWGKSASVLVMGLGHARFLTTPDGRFDTHFILHRGPMVRLRGKIIARNRGRIDCSFALGEDLQGVCHRHGRPSIALLGHGHVVSFR